LVRYSELGRRGEAVDQEFHRHLETLDTEGPIYGAHIAKALANLQDGKLTAPLTLINEALSDSVAFQQYVHFDSPTSYFAAEGGALGFSMPASLGIKLGVADDRYLLLEAAIVLGQLYSVRPALGKDSFEHHGHYRKNPDDRLEKYQRVI